jgi:serine/threonine protein kinase
LIHSRHFVHRDVKPENFVIGLGNKRNLIYLIDFGLSKRFRNNKTGEHIPYRDGRSLCGTARFASIYTHFGIGRFSLNKEQSRRDDLESLGYTIMYFLRGELPWQGMKGKTKQEKYHKIMEKKIQVTPDCLCKGYPGILYLNPEEMSLYFQNCRSLQFEEKPDYNYLRNLFEGIWNKFGLKRDDSTILDWEDINVNRGLNVE